MVQLVTEGIKVSVHARYESQFYENHQEHYAFSYRVTIENNSSQKIQLLSRCWKINDALNETEVIEGKGVIGEQPIILPGERHSYSSGCLLISPIGSMHGYYEMITSQKKIKVGIPLFKLHAPFAMN